MKKGMECLVVDLYNLNLCKKVAFYEKDSLRRKGSCTCVRLMQGVHKVAGSNKAIFASQEEGNLLYHTHASYFSSLLVVSLKTLVSSLTRMISISLIIDSLVTFFPE